MESSGLMNVLGVIGLIIVIILIRKNSANKQGFNIFKMVSRSNIDYLNGLIPDSYIERYREIVENSNNINNFKEKYSNLLEEMEKNNIDIEPLAVLSLKISEEIKSGK